MADPLPPGTSLPDVAAPADALAAPGGGIPAALTPAFALEPGTAMLAPDATAADSAVTPVTAISGNNAVNAADQLKSMLSELAGEDLRGAAGVAVITIVTHSDVFLMNYLETFIVELVRPVYELISLIGQGLLWVIELCGCLDAVQLAETLTMPELKDAIMSADACAPVREVLAGTELVVAAAADFQAVIAAENEVADALSAAVRDGVDLTVQLVSDPLETIVEYLPMIEAVFRALGSAEDSVRAWAKGIAPDAAMLGQSLGLASAMILPLMVPELDPILLTIRGVELAGSMQALGSVGELAKLAESGAADAGITKVLDEFIDALRAGIKKGGLADPFKGGVTVPKLQSLQKLIGVSEQTRQARSLLEEAFIAGGKNVDLRMGSYVGLEKPVGGVNVRGKLGYMFELLESDFLNNPDVALLQSARRDLFARLWDRAHIVDERFFKAQFARDLQKAAGWKNTDAMSCIVVTAGDHRLSVAGLFEATMGHSPLTAAEVDELASITRVFLEKIEIRMEGGRAIASFAGKETSRTSVLIGWVNDTWRDFFRRQHAVIEADSAFSLTKLQEALEAMGR